MKIIHDLTKLYALYPDSWQYISDMILYAEIGADKMNLSNDWVSKTIEVCEESKKFREGNDR